MKSYLYLLIAITSILVQDTSRLTGTYKVEFDKKYAQQGYQISFSDSVYKKIMPDAVTYKGSIIYGKYKTMLQKDKEENPMEIDNREFNKDTIKFATRSRSDLSLIINRGKMIKVKK